MDKAWWVKGTVTDVRSNRGFPRASSSPLLNWITMSFMPIDFLLEQAFKSVER